MDDCHWCEQMAPVVQDVAAHPELQSIQFYSVNSQLLEDSDVIPKVIGKEIDGFPFFVCMDQGKCIHQIDGYSKPEDFAKEIKNSFTKL
jgi:thioredoxin-related protein